MSSGAMATTSGAHAASGARRSPLGIDGAWHRRHGRRADICERPAGSPSESQRGGDDDSISLNWTLNMRRECERRFLGEMASHETNRGRDLTARRRNEKREDAQEISQNQISESRRGEQRPPSEASRMENHLVRSQQAPQDANQQQQQRTSWSVQKKVNNNCAQLARWLAELAKIPPAAQDERQGGASPLREPNTQAHGPTSYRSAGCRTGGPAANEQPPQSDKSGGGFIEPAGGPSCDLQNVGPQVATSCVCCSWASASPREVAARRLESEGNCGGDNLSALSASSSLLSQLLNSSLNQLIEIDNGSSTCCCFCETATSRFPAAPFYGNAQTSQQAPGGDDRQANRLTNARDDLAQSQMSPPVYSNVRHEQQVVDERDLLVVNQTALGQRQALKRAPSKGPNDKPDPLQHFEAEEESTMRRRSALDSNCQDRLSSASSCSTLTAAFASDFERLRQQILEVRKRRRAGRKREPTRAQSETSRDKHEQQFVTFDGPAEAEPIDEPVRQSALGAIDGQSEEVEKVSPGKFMNNRRAQQMAEGQNSECDKELRREGQTHGDLLECCRKICHSTREDENERMMQDSDAEGQATKVNVGPRRSQRSAAREAERQIRSQVLGGELINCSLITSSQQQQQQQQHDSLLEVSKSASDGRAGGRGLAPPSCQLDSSLNSSSASTNSSSLSSLSCFTSLALVLAHNPSCAGTTQASTQVAPGGAAGEAKEQEQHRQRSHSQSLECDARLAPRADGAPPRPSCLSAGAALDKPAADYLNSSARNKCPAKEALGPAFINHHQAQPLGLRQSPREHVNTHDRVHPSRGEARVFSRAPSSTSTPGESGAGGQSQRSSPASASISSSSEVSSSSLGVGSHSSSSSCAIRVTTTSDSSEDCFCGSTGNFKARQERHEGQEQEEEQNRTTTKTTTTSSESRSEICAEPRRTSADCLLGPLDKFAGASISEDNERRLHKQFALAADCDEPKREAMGLIGSRRQHERNYCDDEIYQSRRRRRKESASGGGNHTRQHLKQYKRVASPSSPTRGAAGQAHHDFGRQIDLICSSDLQFDACELRAWESKFAHPSSSSCPSSAPTATATGRNEQRALPLREFVAQQQQQKQKQSQNNLYITKHHQLSQAAQFYARNQEAFVALPLRRVPEGEQQPRQEKRPLGGDDHEETTRAGRHQQAIFSLDPSLEAADRASMVEATAQMVRVVTSRDSSRPSSRASSTPAGNNNARAIHHQVASPIDDLTGEPIYDVPSLSLIDTNNQRCLSPDQKYPNSGALGQSNASPVQRTSPGVEVPKSAQVAFFTPDSLAGGEQRKHKQQQEARAIISKRNQQRAGEISHAENLVDASGDREAENGRAVLFRQHQSALEPEGQTTLARDAQRLRGELDGNLGDPLIHQRREGPGESHGQRDGGHETATKRDDCDHYYYYEQRERWHDSKHKSFEEAGQRTGASLRNYDDEQQRETTKKKVACTQPSETKTTSANGNATTTSRQASKSSTATNLNATTTTIRHRAANKPGGSRQINNFDASSKTSLCSCSTCSDQTNPTNQADGISNAIYGSCSCSAQPSSCESCSCCPLTSSASATTNVSSVLYILRNRHHLRRLARLRRSKLLGRHRSRLRSGRSRCSCSDIESQQTSDRLSPGSLTQAYLRRHHKPPGANKSRDHRRRRRRVNSGFGSPPRGRRHMATSSVLGARLLRKLRHSIRHPEASGHRRSHGRHRNSAMSGRSSHGGHAGCAHTSGHGSSLSTAEGRGPVSSRVVDSYKVFENEREHEQGHDELPRPSRGLIRSEHATGAPPTKVGITKSRPLFVAEGGARGPPTAGELLDVLDEEEEEEEEEALGDDGEQQPHESDLVGGRGAVNTSGNRDVATVASPNWKTFKNDNQRPQLDDSPGGRGGLIIDARTTGRPEGVGRNQLDNHNKRKPTKHPDGPALNLTPSGASLRRDPLGKPDGARLYSPNDDLNRHRSPRSVATSGCSACRPCSCASSTSVSCASCSRCSRTTEPSLHHHHHHHRHHHSHRHERSHRKSQREEALIAWASQELERIRALRRREQKLVRRLMELETGQEISSSSAVAANGGGVPSGGGAVGQAASAATKQLKIEYLARRLGAVARELKSRRRSYKSRVRHHDQDRDAEELKRRHKSRLAVLAMSPPGGSRFNDLLSGKPSPRPLDNAHARHLGQSHRDHDITRTERGTSRGPRARTNEGYPAGGSSRRRRIPSRELRISTRASGLLRWRHRSRQPISGLSASTVSRSTCCRRRRRHYHAHWPGRHHGRRHRHYLSSSPSSCVSGSLITSLSRGAHLTSGRRHLHRRLMRKLGRNRQLQTRPRRLVQTSDSVLVQQTRAAAAAAATTFQNNRNMTSPAGQAATVGQLRNMQQALISSAGRTNIPQARRGKGALSSVNNNYDQHMDLSRRRHDLNHSLALVTAAAKYGHKQHGRRSSGRKRQLDDSGVNGQEQQHRRRNEHYHRSSGQRQVKMGDPGVADTHKFLVKRMDPNELAKFSKPKIITTTNQPSMPLIWQLTNQCHCKHCCLVDTLVRMDLEARRRRKLEALAGVTGDRQQQRV